MIQSLFSYYWKLENFSFCDLYCNQSLNSPKIEINVPIKSKWQLFMYPNGYGDEKYVGIFLRRLQDAGPQEISVFLKISLIKSNGVVGLGEGDLNNESMKYKFSKKSEYGFNELIKRSELNKVSEYLESDNLTILCEFKLRGSTESEGMYNSKLYQKDSTENIEKLRNSMKTMYENNIYSDISFKSGNCTFTANRCILQARLPDFFKLLKSSPDKCFTDEFISKKILYAYTGNLDFMDFACFDVKKMLGKRNFLRLQGRICAQNNTFRACTHFQIKKQTFSWKIRQSDLTCKNELSSRLISNEKISIHLSMKKTGDEFWSIFIKVKFSDDIFIKCTISVKNDNLLYDEFEHAFKRNESFQCPTILSTTKDLLIFNGKAVPLPYELTLDFAFTYPTGNRNHSMDLESCEGNSCDAIDDSIKLSMDLRELFYSQSVVERSVQHTSDMTVQAGIRLFNAHKCILSARSPAFRVILRCNKQVQKEIKIIIQKSIFKEMDDDLFADIMEKFLLFVYSGQFDPPTEEVAHHLQKLIDLYMVGK